MEKNRDYGAAMVIAMVIMAFIFGLGAAYISTTTTQEQLSTETINQAMTFQAAQACFDMAKLFLFAKGTANWDAQLSDSANNEMSYVPGNYYYNYIKTDVTPSNFLNPNMFEWCRNIQYNDYVFSARLTDNDDHDDNLLDDCDELVKLDVIAFPGPVSGVMVTDPVARDKAILIEALVRYQIPYYEPTAAVVVGGSIKVFGSAKIEGTQGNLQANGNVEVAGAAFIAQNVYATGNITAPEGSIGGQPYPGYAPANIPPISPTKYAGYAGYVLQSNGKVLNKLTDPQSEWAPPYMGWDFSGGNWVYNTGVANNGAFYAEATDPANPQLGPHVSVSGSPNNWQVTIIAEGHVDISGSPTMSPYTQNVAVIAGTDLKIAGSAANPYDGLYAAHEQIKFIGTPKVNGVTIAENKAEKDAFVGDATIEFDIAVGGNTAITYNGGMTTFFEDGDRYIKILGFRKSIWNQP
ncbi:MAG: hypothetical protein HY762_02475 [Planctomycetes bacterium]|nr:hypothetical protein [Planctomycetota bacterium]